jgi:predicted nucleic acid-binding protein
VRFVLDASVALRWFVAEERSENADAVYPRALETFEQGILPLLRSGMLRDPMTDNVASKAGRYVAAGLTGDDACYASLAEELGAVWLTFDRRAHTRIREEGISSDISEGLPAGL